VWNVSTIPTCSFVNFVMEEIDSTQLRILNLFMIEPKAFPPKIMLHLIRVFVSKKTNMATVVLTCEYRYIH